VGTNAEVATHDLVLGWLGTHYPTTLLMGGISFFYSTFNQSALDSMQQSSTDLEAAASLDFLVHVGADVSKDEHYKDWQTFNGLKHGSTAHGSPNPAPPCGGTLCSDTSAWFNSIQALDGSGPGPSPLQMTLAPISDLLTSKCFPTDPGIAAKQAQLIQFLEESYCGSVPNCAPPPPPPPPPPAVAWESNLGGRIQHND
jgi:hypothetical protein